MNPRLGKIEDAASDWVLRREAGLAPAEAREFEIWKNSDPRHGEAIARHERAWSLLDRQREAGHGADLMRDLSLRASRRGRRRFAAGAAAVAALLISGWLWRAQHPGGVPAPAENAVVLLPEKRTLPDGSVIELRRGAEIAVDFSGPVRRVTLRKGEALFEVAKNKEHPFVVSAGGIEVQAVGTAFVVQLQGQKMDVVVTEGRVRVGAEQPAADRLMTQEHSPARDPELFLDAGHSLSLEVGAKEPALPTAEAEKAMSQREIADRLSWRAPRVEFSETLLRDAVSVMNRRSAIRLVIDDPTLAAVRVNGLFRADDSEAFARLLEANFGVEARRAGDVITLRLARR